MVTTEFETLVEIKLPVQVGQGWHASIEVRKIAERGERVTVTTEQTTSCEKLDDRVSMEFSGGWSTKQPFDWLGRLIACGAIRQIVQNNAFSIKSLLEGLKEVETLRFAEIHATNGRFYIVQRGYNAEEVGFITVDPGTREPEGYINANASFSNRKKLANYLRGRGCVVHEVSTEEKNGGTV